MTKENKTLLRAILLSCAFSCCIGVVESTAKYAGPTWSIAGGIFVYLYVWSGER